MLKSLASMPPMLALSIAIICEVIATSMLPKTQQFTQPLPTVVTLVGYAAAFFLLSVTVKSVPIGIAYAIWCGAGIVLVAMISWLWHGQQLDLAAVIGMLLILAGTLVINLFSGAVSH
ncbi:QacE family quaternary ammonium compound efflux SMR transporter [Photobacterium ganghwense]|uniref:Multidrug transporter n=2 Tax=Vibrionaceae TaxID=641 RepID=A0A0J1HG54_9GAMM|nr:MULTISPECIES: SMR family transporter [Photobacterium]KLV10610.1 multidrug transporter [Photobacterium ganghwense]MBV1842538.1 QacE family quaternary ammonium compound efflux SMR transporter [Photobacterium ganghwense]PSU09479.1 QacE family quaternary ammonium compound efflux SMR transporter [Photobacterium ganghwense]QSV16722.1 QacE family quaternary ammonium compound efflux SMR transporter [Photobacterium ganghwense]